MPEKKCVDLAQEILEEIKARHPKHSFIVIAIKPEKHPDNGTPGYDQAIVSNLSGRGPVISWLSSFLIRAAQGFGSNVPIRHKL